MIGQSELKRDLGIDVLTAARQRIARTFDLCERVYVSFSGGKDSTVMLHLVMDEAIRRDRKVGLLIIDLEAQYRATIDHVRLCVDKYREHVELFWVCLPMALRNAVSNYEPRWICWEPGVPWVRDEGPPADAVTDPRFFPFFRAGMEFEEFMVLFGIWYSEGQRTGAFVGIRADESLNRFRTIASKSKQTLEGEQWTTRVDPRHELYNIYPVYDWRVGDLWIYHHVNPRLPYNQIYDLMYRAGLTPAQMRLCQPYGDDQRRGLWLFHILEPQTWFKVVNRVSGANAGALYVQETGNVMGYRGITRPPGQPSWKAYAELLMGSLPRATQEHYLKRFRVFVKWWRKRGYPDDIPDEAPAQLENKGLAPSYRRICKVLLRNDYWCKGLKFSQPKSEVYKAFVREKKAERRAKETNT